jgi:hypothetical protein
MAPLKLSLGWLLLAQQERPRQEPFRLSEKYAIAADQRRALLALMRPKQLTVSGRARDHELALEPRRGTPFIARKGHLEDL